MLNYSETKKIILSLLIGSVIIFLSYLGAKIEFSKLSRAINNKLWVFGQEVIYQIFPRYPQRLIHLTSNIAFHSDTLSLLTKELNQLIETCDCQYAQSACIGGKSQAQAQKTIEKEFSVGLSSETAKKIDEAVLSIDSKIRESMSEVKNETKNAFDKTRQELDKIKPGEETQKPEAKLKFFSLAQAESEIINIEVMKEAEKKLEKIENQTLGELTRKEAEVRSNIKTYKNNFKNELDKLKNYPKEEILEKSEKAQQNFLKDTENELKKLAPEKISQELDATLKDFSQQIEKLPSQIVSEFQANFQEILTGLKGELERTIPLQDIFALVKNPLEFLFKGGCRANPTIGVFGDPCLKVRKAIEDKQLDIKEEITQFSYFQALLKKEMETGLEEELKKLMPKEEFEKLKTNIRQIDQYNQNLISLAERQRNLSYQDFTKKCSANCNLGNIFGLKACLAAGTGEQRAIELKFKAGVSLEDLNLGQVGIKNINLALPEMIEVPKFGTFSPFTIIGDKVVIDVEKTRADEVKPPPIKPQIPSLPSLPKPPALSFSCADMEKQFSSYSCASADQTITVESVESEWFFQVFSYLPEACQKLPNMSEPNMSDRWLTEKAENCFNPDKVIKTINEECDILWQKYCSVDGIVPEPPPICKKIRYGCFNYKVLDDDISAAVQCQNLFKQEGLTIPAQCSYISANFYGAEYYYCSNLEYPTLKGSFCLNKNFNPVSALKNKCQELKEKYPKEPPEPCKILALFLGQIENPKEEKFFAGGGACPVQKISDAPASIPGCGASPLTIPKIKLPKIIIPDITLPYFRIWPFLEIKLPNFIFEDLVLPDIELCNLDNCQNIFPDLKFEFPFLTFPSLDFPPIDLGEVLGVPLPDIQLPSIQFPPIPFPFFKLPSLGDLMMPDLDLPSIPLPKPKITFAFEGIDTGAIFALIKTFILNALGVPDFSLCIDFKLNLIPLRIVFPDYYFYWPAFPRIPEIPFCKDVRQFCQDAKTSLKEITDKTKIIERTFNQFVQREIQAKLDQAANEIREKYKQHILQELENQKEEIRRKVEEQIKRGEKQIIISLDDINVPSISLDEELGLPDKIPIPWPDVLKEIPLTKPLSYDLPKIPLSFLSYEKEIPIKGPGFQERTFTADFGVYGDCLAEPPQGGNPYPLFQFQTILNDIENNKTNLQEASLKIIQTIETAIY